MKKKVLLLTGILLLSLATVVSAAAMWGQYKGYDIIRITVDGKTVKPTDAPAIKFNGRTMVPIYMLQQAGVKYQWDDKNKTVAVESNDSGQVIADVKAWSYIATYYSEFKAIESEYYNAQNQISSTLIYLDNYTGPDSNKRQAVENTATRVLKLGESLESLVQTFRPTVIKHMNEIGYPTKKLEKAENLYHDAYSLDVDALESLSEYYKTGHQMYFDFTLDSLNKAITTLQQAHAIANEEFYTFQNAIMDYK